MLNVRSGVSVWSPANAVISEESIPPERNDPSGTSLRIRIRTESLSNSRMRYRLRRHAKWRSHARGRNPNTAGPGTPGYRVQQNALEAIVDSLPDRAGVRDVLIGQELIYRRWINLLADAWDCGE